MQIGCGHQSALCPRWLGMASLKALFWDVDGTLADTEMDGHRPAFNAAFHDLELPFIWMKSSMRSGHPGGQRRVKHYAREQGRAHADNSTRFVIASGCITDSGLSTGRYGSAGCPTPAG